MSRSRKRSSARQPARRRAQAEAVQQPLPLTPAPLLAEQKRQARARLRALARLLAVVEREYHRAVAECERLGLAAGGPEARSADRGPRSRGVAQMAAESPTEALPAGQTRADLSPGEVASLLQFLDDLNAALAALPEQ